MMKNMENLYKNLTTEEELELCYKYFLKMVSGEVSGAVTEGFNDRFYNANNSFVDTFYGFLVALRGFDKFPTVVSDEIYDKIEGQELYHGYKDFDHGCEMMADKIYNLGTGNTTPGMFFTSSRNEAEFYTAGQNVSAYDFTPLDKERVLKVKVVGKAVPPQTRFFLRFFRVSEADKNIEKIENVQDKMKLQLLHNFSKTLPSDFGKRFYDLFKQNIGICMCYLGYDYSFEGRMVYILANRGKILIPKSEAKRFFKYSINYKNALGKSVLVIDDLSKVEEIVNERTN